MVNQACRASQLCQQREEASLKSVYHDSDLSQFNRLHSWRQPHQQHNRELKYLLGFPTFAKETPPHPPQKNQNKNLVPLVFTERCFLVKAARFHKSALFQFLTQDETVPSISIFFLFLYFQLKIFLN